MKIEDYKRLLDSSEGVPVVYQDFMVQAWRIYDTLEKAKERFKKYSNLETIVKCCWSVTLNSTPVLELFGENRVIVISDYKSAELGGYWRHKEVGEDERIKSLWQEYKPRKKNLGYKGGREEKPKDFVDLVVRVGREYCQKYMNFYEFKGYEADDIAGFIYRNCGEQINRVKILHTVDRDWIQLVDEKRGFYWATSRVPKENERFQNQVANDEEVLLFSELKHGWEINTPKQYIEAKIVTGDAGDNLPPNCPPEYMDLTIPHQKYNIDTLAINSGLVQDSYNYEPNTNREHYLNAKKVLREMKII